MAVSKKMSEAGWFYHAPMKRGGNEPVDVPPASQIPGLSDIPYDPNDPRDQPKSLLRDTDTKYVRLAKMGGRQDLLRFKDFVPKTKEATGYPRVDWFYIEDIRAEEADKPKEKWDFKLPEYMVHEEYRPDGHDNEHEPYKPKRPPYIKDTSTVFQREGRDATNKTVKLPELTRDGYGVRQNKAKNKPVIHAKQPPKEKPIKPAQSEMVNRPRYLPMPELNLNEKPSIGKILSNGYASDWHTDVKKWQEKQDKARDKFDNLQNIKETVSTEYHDNIDKVAENRSAQKTKKETNAVKNQKPVKQQESEVMKRLREEEEKPLFKLSRFTKVSSKVNSHRHYPVTHTF